MTQGAFIVLEGTDGSGKGTQFKILAEKLQAEGYDVELFDFPQYDQPSSYFVKEYLNGHYGTADQIGPYTASLFYALDRFDAAERIQDALAAGKIVLANRFTGSNMAHQGTKFRDSHERRGYFIWLDNLEFEMLKIPRPDRNLVLRVPAEVAQQLVDKKEKRSYTDKQRDIHEADLSHLQRSVEVYDDLCQLFPKDYSRIDCVRGGSLMDIDAISRLVLETVRPLLPKPQHKHGRPARHDTPAGATSDPPVQPAAKSAAAGRNKYMETSTDGQPALTEEGERLIQAAVSNINSPVYAISTRLESMTAVAALARWSLRGDDPRTTLTTQATQDENRQRNEGSLLREAISKDTGNPLADLAGQYIIIQNASQLLLQRIESYHSVAFMERAARHDHFDEKDQRGNYRYVIPDGLDKRVRQAYTVSMDVLFRNYASMVRQMTTYVREHSTTPANRRDDAWKVATRAQACQAVRPILPAAAASTVGIFVSARILDSMVTQMLADRLPEVRQTGLRVLDEARAYMPVFLEGTGKPGQGGETVTYLASTRDAVKALADEYLPNNHTDAVQPGATLADIWPRNELDLVTDMLYEHSQLPMRELQMTVADWTYERKSKVLHAYMGERLNRRHIPGRVLEKAQYGWDIVSDYGAFRDLQRLHAAGSPLYQELTPRYGYDVPKLIDDAGLTDLFEECFDLSLRLYSILQQHGFGREAQYATLLGHRVRWSFTYNAREAFQLHELHAAPRLSAESRLLIGQMHDIIAERHPLIAEAMCFVERSKKRHD